MKTKTKIEKQVQKKTNPELVKTILACKKNKEWLEVANILSSPRRKRVDLNLSQINNNIKDEKIVAIPGKVLSQGDLDKKIKVIALDFSEMAKEKIKKSGSDAVSILEEIKKNPEAKGIKILKQK